MKLYFSPMSCALACRIVALEAGINLDYVRVDFTSGNVIGSEVKIGDISRMGRVPILELDDGSLLTENAAVLQYLDEFRVTRKIKDPSNQFDRFRLYEALSFVGTELHKAYLFPVFSKHATDASREFAQGNIRHSLNALEGTLFRKNFYVGDHFSVADAYLVWALILIQSSGYKLAEFSELNKYYNRMLQRESVLAATKIERELYNS
ncbi:glutathione binding-like protein [Gammaproteobacteria bacterium]|nr:glutathione binding-like protein [Gammaproteobacteria bacterium]